MPQSYTPEFKKKIDHNKVSKKIFKKMKGFSVENRIGYVTHFETR